MWFALATLLTQGNKSVLVQFFAATQCSKNVYLLTTTSQPFGFFGNNEQLQAFRKGSLKNKLYVYKDVEKKEGVAFGLAGHSFQNLAFQYTENVHEYYPKDQRPPCEDAIFENIWRSFDFPLIYDGKCYGVLDFIVDTPEGTSDDCFLAGSNALQREGFQFSFHRNPPSEFKTISGRRKKPVPKTKSKRVTKTSDIAEYRFFVPYMGMTSEIAREKLGLVSAAKKIERAIALEELGQATAAEKLRHDSAKQKSIPESTFGNLREKIGLPEWPRVPVPKTRVNQAQSETSSSVPPSAELTSTMDEEILIALVGDVTGVEYQGNNAPIQDDTDIMEALRNIMDTEEDEEMDTVNPNAIMDLIPDNTIWDYGFDEQPQGQNYNAIPSAQEAQASQTTCEIDEDSDPNLFFDFDSIDWSVDETK